MHNTSPFVVPSHQDVRLIQQAHGDNARVEDLISGLADPGDAPLVAQVREALTGLYLDLPPRGRTLLFERALAWRDARFLNGLLAQRREGDGWPWRALVHHGLVHGWGILRHATPVDMKRPDVFGFLPLTALASIAGVPASPMDALVAQAAAVPLLVQAGADPNQRTSALGTSPVSQAIAGGLFPLTDALIQAGALPPTEGLRTLVTSLSADWNRCDMVPLGTEWDGLEVIPEAARFPREQGCWFARTWRLLVEHGLDPNATADGQESPLALLQLIRPDWAATWEARALSQHMPPLAAPSNVVKPRL